MDKLDLVNIADVKAEITAEAVNLINQRFSEFTDNCAKPTSQHEIWAGIVDGTFVTIADYPTSKLRSLISGCIPSFTKPEPSTHYQHLAFAMISDSLTEAFNSRFPFGNPLLQDLPENGLKSGDLSSDDKKGVDVTTTFTPVDPNVIANSIIAMVRNGSISKEYAEQLCKTIQSNI